MTNFAKSRAEIEAMPDGLVAVEKPQLLELVDKAEIGQNAERHLNFILKLVILALVGIKASA